MADVRRTRGRGVADELLRTVRVERMGGFAKRVIVRFFMLGASPSTDDGLRAGGSSAVGGYRDINVRSSVIARSTSPFLDEGVSMTIDVGKIKD